MTERNLLSSGAFFIVICACFLYVGLMCWSYGVETGLAANSVHTPIIHIKESCITWRNYVGR